jgi:hypothetical protein
VNDILALVREKLPGVANKAGLEAIAMQCDFALPGVETVDVTDELVLMFDPSEKTLATVKELRKNAPIDLDELEGNHEH